MSSSEAIIKRNLAKSPTCGPAFRQMPTIERYVCHSGKRVLEIALELGWGVGACYTNLRNVRKVDAVGFLDIDWKSYDFRRHLAATKATRPRLTVAQDITNAKDLHRTLEQASELAQYAEQVVIVPKDKTLEEGLEERIPDQFPLGYSVPTKHGGTVISPHAFKRPVHLLGGRPDAQRRLANVLPVASIDCNRFTLDAGFGDYFDGEIFRPHPVGGYVRCITDSIRNINELWRGYVPSLTMIGTNAIP